VSWIQSQPVIEPVDKGFEGAKFLTDLFKRNFHANIP